MIDHGKHSVLGVRIDAVDYQAALERIFRAAHERRPMAVSAMAVHSVMTGALDPAHRCRLNRFDLLVPDGQPVRWALRWLHRVKLPDRVYGPNLTLEICRRAAEQGLPIFLFGGTPETIAALVANLREAFPALEIAGAESPPFRPLDAEEDVELVRRVNASGARLMFIGLGCPKQDYFAADHVGRIEAVQLCVGAAFDFLAGAKPIAPKWMQRRGLEWAYRLMCEPRRLWKRYLLLNPLYLTLIALQLLGLRDFDHSLDPSPRGELP